MRFRTTLILAAVFAGLLAYVFLVEEPKREQEAKKKTLLAAQADDVTGVTLTFADREIVLKNVDGTWRVVGPVDAPADAVTVTNLINAAVQAEATKDLGDAGGNLAQYGLDKPFVAITLTTKDKTLPTVLVGKTTPVGAAVYAKLADAPNVVLTGGALRAGMDKQAKDLRDKTIVAFGDPELRKIELRGDGKDIVLAQQDNAWRIEQPFTSAADPAAVRNFLSSLRSLRATDFPADQPTGLAAYGLDKPRLQITLTLGDQGNTQTLLIGAGNDKKEMYVQRAGQPTVYTVSDFSYRDLDKSVNDFRDKTVLAFEPAKVVGLSIASADGTFALMRGEANTWRLDGSDAKIAASAVTQYLDELRELKGWLIAADLPADLKTLGLEPPSLTVTLTGEGSQEIGTVLIGKRPSGEGQSEYTAMAGGGSTVFVARDYLVKRLEKKADAFVEKPTPVPGTPRVGGPPAEALEDEGMLGEEPVDPGD